MSVKLIFQILEDINSNINFKNISLRINIIEEKTQIADAAAKIFNGLADLERMTV